MASGADVAGVIAVFIPIVAIISVTVIRPWIKMHYASQGALTSDERQAMADLRQVAERMETRIQTLERILDAEAPGWRERA